MHKRCSNHLPTRHKSVSHSSSLSIRALHVPPLLRLELLNHIPLNRPFLHLDATPPPPWLIEESVGPVTFRAAVVIAVQTETQIVTDVLESRTEMCRVDFFVIAVRRLSVVVGDVGLASPCCCCGVCVKCVNEGVLGNVVLVWYWSTVFGTIADFETSGQKIIEEDVTMKNAAYLTRLRRVRRLLCYL